MHSSAAVGAMSSLGLKSMCAAVASRLDIRRLPSNWVLIVVALAIATWPVWRWMAHRFADGSGDMWELLAAVTAIAMLVRDQRATPSEAMAQRRDGPRSTMVMLRNRMLESMAVAPNNSRVQRAVVRQISVTLAFPALLVLAYAASYAFLSPLPRGMLAMAAMGTAVSALWYGRRVDIPILGLLLISLPVMASLNFYLGYPLRVIAGTVTEALLQMNGIAAVRDGAQLQWNDQVIAIDAPCSGVKMLWTGAYLSFSLAALMRLSTLRSIALASLAVVVVIAANAMRATSLFYVEAGLIPGPEFLHEAIGLVMFAFAAATLFVAARKLVTHVDAEHAASFPRSGCGSASIHPGSSERGATSACLFIAVCLLAALVPLATLEPATAAHAGFPGWPSEFEGKSLRAIPLSTIEENFAQSFPGNIGRFSDGRREIVMRWIASPTRKLHPASDCFKGSGYHVKPLPLERINNQTWGAFSAERGTQQLHVREAIADGNGKRWTDVSAWYWAAIRGETQPPWMAITVAASGPTQTDISVVPLTGAE
ncbi:archaeosortase/exosortase family protein [Steroidobacter sp.]|uniref:archaeosortase/exosortase family protein n=1 Tax=Steroidobacter sp. TaxID=1978227 RepID=UPI0025F0637D|nr:archaeosortase/exosortase family protein [Steroidobacter sp.]